MPPRVRLDAELVRRGLAGSRQQAAELIAAGKVNVRGVTAAKAATGVERDVPLQVRDTDEPRWASRGAHKLLGALAAFGGEASGEFGATTEPLVVAGRRCLDAGASTGGFTDVLLRHGAAEVVAVDVGYGQLAWQLRTDSRVHVLDRTNVRYLTPEAIGGPVELVVADLSFISLRTVLPAMVACTGQGGELLPLVKPQFEVGRERLGSGGVVRDPELRMAALTEVAAAAIDLGLAIAGAVASPLPGPAGNVEYVLRLRKGRGNDGRAEGTSGEIQALLRHAVEAGPQ